ncbi:hypothetical protein B0H10DRAFT_2226452 [Mycena sp. CBHHK59/15]|nr:hypothetical protein B0H10DRAFT_2226452 [Mycena sp. CBHHK59/15]
MWQQLDRKIDEVFDAFYRVNDRLRGDYKAVRLTTQLSKRAIRPTIEDEFDAFARWIGRRPIFVRRFYNHAVEFDHIGTQGPDDYHINEGF